MPQGRQFKINAENVISDDDLSNLLNCKYVKISNADSGIGISQKNMDKIFNPYFSIKKKGSKKGTGLGLSICHTIIRKHGGNVTVESKYRRGTTFHIYLPSANRKSPDQRTAATTEQEIPVFGKDRILVMDDEAMIRKLAGELLSYLGYEVGFALDGDEAIKRYKEAMNSKSPFDAVILDLTVKGGMGGKETIQKLTKIDLNVVAIVSIGYCNDSGITDFGQYGISGVVTKPYTMSELSEKLNQVVSNRQI